MNDMKVYPIGKIENEHNKVKIILDPSYKKGLTGLSGYSHVQVLWWMEVDVRNMPSQRMLEKCGYLKEGLIRQGKMVNTWCDYFIYGILSSDLAGK